MVGHIFNIQDDGRLVEMNEQAFENEDIFQELLTKYPNLLAGDQIQSESPRRWLLIRREMGVPSQEAGCDRWSLDHLFLDQDAIPTLVEVKRSSDTRLRREVVGQMLDYAANAVVYWPVEKMQAEYERSCESEAADPHERLATFLGDSTDLEEFWQQVKTNLQAGKIRMLFVADVIPPELRRIIEFLNEQMDPAEVLGVEIRHYVGQGLKTLVPRVIGQTAEAEKRKAAGAPGRQWDEASFLSEMTERRDSEEVSIARTLLEWSRKNLGAIRWGKGKADGSLLPMLTHKGIQYRFFGVFTNGVLDINFSGLSGKPPFSDERMRLELLEQLNHVPGISLPEDAITKWITVPLATLKEQTALNMFLETMQWAAEQVRNS